MSSQEVRHYIERDLLIENEYSTLVNISEVYYGWGVDKKSIQLTHRQFTQKKKCVYGIYVLRYRNI